MFICNSEYLNIDQILGYIDFYPNFLLLPIDLDKTWNIQNNVKPRIIIIV